MDFSYELKKTDAVIIGGGLAGLMAASRLNMPSGMKLAILKTGNGASPYVHGFSAPLHEDDSVDYFIQDTLKSGIYQNNEKLVNKLCSESLAMVELLESMGIEFDRTEKGYELLRPLGASFPRVVCSSNFTGIVIMDKLKELLKSRENVTMYDSLRALRLMVEDGIVHGVLTYDISKKTFVCIEAKAVIIATGGFCNIFPFSTNTSDISGDGIAMAYNAGVPLVDMEFVQFEPCVAVYPPEVKGKGIVTTMFYEGAVLRNADGDRFALKYGSDAEKVNKDVLSRMIYQEIKNGKGTAHGGVYFDATEVGAEKLYKLYPAYVKRYANVGVDITKEMIEVAPAPHTSLGGIAINPDCSTVIKGLFACGEVTGGIHGANRIGGNAGLETLVFGKCAGESTANYLENSYQDKFYRDKTYLNNSVSTIHSGTSSHQWKSWINSIIMPGFANKTANRSVQKISCEKMKAIRTKMENILSNTLSIVRNEEGLRYAVKELGTALNEIENSHAGENCTEIYMKLRLQNDLTASYILALAALERGETTGCHIRSEDSNNDTLNNDTSNNGTSENDTLKNKALENKVLENGAFKYGAMKGNGKRYSIVIRKGNHGPIIKKQDNLNAVSN